MSVIDIPEQCYTEAGRLATFQTSKRRASSRAPKPAKWPHNFLLPEKLAEAGFFFLPNAENPDNVTCFLCKESICGWEPGDDPLDEHLKLSPHCGWAIVSSIEKKDTSLSGEHPLNVRMLEARRATFGDRWPHEGKKGWKCKVKALVEAGWIYKPTPESDDFATCVYCGLGLDGWEPSDKPLDEHHRRVPTCAFFTLIAELSPATKKTTKARKPRASKAASRLSTQSTFTSIPEPPSLVDITAREDESVLTTATTASPSGRKMAKGKKTAGKGRKNKAKADEPSLIAAPFEPEDDDFEVKVQPKPAPKRGTKRASAAIQDSSVIEVEAPAPKRRTTRARGSIAIHNTYVPPPASVDVSMASIDHVNEKPIGRGKGRQSTVKGTRKASTASKAPLRPPPHQQEDIDVALHSDVDMEHVEVEEPKAPTTRRQSRAPKSNNQVSAAPARKTRASKVTKADYSMFSTEAMDIDDATIEAELKAMEVEESQPLPKAKGAKGKQTRKPSAKKQAASKAAEDSKMDIDIPVPESEPEKPVKGRRAGSRVPSHNLSKIQNPKVSASMDDSELPEPDFDNTVLHHEEESNDNTEASQDTVVQEGNKRRATAVKKTASKKKAAEKKVEEPVDEDETEEPQVETKPKKAGRSKKAAHVDEDETPKPAPEPVEAPAATKPTKAKSTKSKAKGKAAAAVVEEPQPEPVLQSTEEEPEPMEAIPEPAPHAAPAAHPISPKPSMSTKDLTPSPSPQSSDAENHPPSSKPSTATKQQQAPPSSQATSRIPLAPTALLPGTPTRLAGAGASALTLSPSKRNIIAGLQSSMPWSAVDLDHVFAASPGGSPGKENAGKENGVNVGMSVRGLMGPALQRARSGELTSPEKRMSVEEWVLFNARVAEEGFRDRCEGLVSRFEREALRGVAALEGVGTVD